ncbi:MAG: ABC transporter ATP-binding protein, partial [Clostridia bacterium]|nr:ABC transporter ATP-binding protein [Clostridia bacterium]
MAEKNTEIGDKNEKKKMPAGQVIRYNFLMLRKIARLTPQYIVFMFAVGIIGGISSSIETIFTYKLFNALDRPDITFGEIAGYALLILGVDIGIKLFYAWYYQYYQTVTDKKLQHRMHSELFNHALKMDLACYDDPKFYNDYVWAMDESKGRAVQVLDDTSRIIRYVITLSTLITLMMQVDIVVGLILFVGCILNATMWGLGTKIEFKKNERVKPLHRKNSYINRVYHLADYAKELRISHAGEKLNGIYAESVTEIVEEEVKNGKKMYLLSILEETVSVASQFLPVILLLFKLYEGTAPLGSFVASINIIWNLNWSMYDLARKLIRMPDNAQYIGKYLAFLAYQPKIVGGDLIAEPLREIELRNVTFAYQTSEEGEGDQSVGEGKSKAETPKNSLEGIDLTIKKGEKIAIVGYNGAGKTTLTKLLMRLYDPTEGQILYNGRDLREYDIDSLRARIGTVFQDYKIFAATIAENVLCGECDDTMRDTVTDALTKATFREKL